MAKADNFETNRKWFRLTRVDDNQKKSGDAIETKTLRVEPNDEYENMVKRRLQYLASQHEALFEHLS